MNLANFPKWLLEHKDGLEAVAQDFMNEGHNRSDEEFDELFKSVFIIFHQKRNDRLEFSEHKKGWSIMNPDDLLGTLAGEDTLARVYEVAKDVVEEDGRILWIYNTKKKKFFQIVPSFEVKEMEIDPEEVEVEVDEKEYERTRAVGRDLGLKVDGDSVEPSPGSLSPKSPR